MNLKNIFQVYTLFVCSICTIILIVTISLFLNSATDILIPQYKHYSQLIRYESNDNYLRFYTGTNRVKGLQGLSPTQLDEERAKDKQEFLEEKKARGLESMITIFEWALIAFIFFFIHLRLYQRSK